METVARHEEDLLQITFINVKNLDKLSENEN